MASEIQIAIIGICSGLVVAIALSFIAANRVRNEVWESRNALELSITKKLFPRLMDHFCTLFVTAFVIKDDIRASDIVDFNGNIFKSLLLAALLCCLWHFVFRYMLGNPGLGAIKELKASLLNWRISLLHSIISFVACATCMATMATVFFLSR